MTDLILENCSDWLGGKGILSIITNNHNVPWKNAVSGLSLDLDYYGNKSGSKIISPLVAKLIDNNGISDANMAKLASLIYSKYGLNWDKLWDATQLEYNPIHNYDGDETETVTVTTEGTGSNESDMYGFNSTTAVKSNESSSSIDNTSTTTRTLSKGGNLGVTSTQQMLEQEYNLRINYTFFDVVFDNIDEIMVIDTYGNIDTYPNNVIIQSSYTLHPATSDKLGGIKVGDNLTITSDGTLSATGGGGSSAVTSVNGKTGAVVLNASDVNAYGPTNTPPYPVTSVNGSTGAVSITADGLGAYSPTNTPPYPVTSVNGSTGSVTITADGLGAYSPTNTPPYPVTSVNGSTGEVTLTADDIETTSGDTIEESLTTLNNNITNKIKYIESNDISVLFDANGLTQIDLSSAFGRTFVSDYRKVINIEIYSFSGNYVEARIYLPYTNLKSYANGKASTQYSGLRLRAFYYE